MVSFLISLNSICNCCILVIILSLLQISHGVPDAYCLAPLNKSNCGKPAVAVFSYWLPGSRCELEFWRGCPTINKFPDEYVCSHYCIGTLLRPKIIDYNEIGPLDRPEDNVCNEEFNAEDCEGEPTDVFTYNKTANICVEVTWRGCDTRNRFEDEEQCTTTCEAEKVTKKNKMKVTEATTIDNTIDDTTTEHSEEHTTATDETTTEETTTEETTTEAPQSEETTTDEGGHVDDLEST